MLNNLKNILIGILSAVIVVAVGASAYSAFASPGAGETAAPAIASENGNNGYGGSGNGQVAGGNGSGTSVLDLPASDLSEQEAEALLYMREEEKLARDVYNALYAIWGQPTFRVIATSEEGHLAEIKTLLDRYALADPAQAPGVFTDPNLQALYDQLVAQGSVSLSEALKVGAAIEEIDILDLQARLAQTDNADIQQVFNNLMTGSSNHLQAFTSVLLTQTGEVYQPQYLSVEAYAAIVSGQNGNGNQGQAEGQNGQGAQGQGGNGYRGGANGGAAGNNTNAPAAQANLTGTSTLSGTVSAYDGATLTVATADGGSTVVQLGNAQYTQSIGFYAPLGASVTVTGFTDDQGQFSAITVTVNGQTYTFRDESGRVQWSGGRGNGRGGNR